MGNSLLSLLNNVLRNSNDGVTSMGSYTNKNLKVRWLGDSSSTFLADDTVNVNVLMETGRFLNR
jgi:hypothetical protein